MTVCEKCGNPIEEGKNFCENCSGVVLNTKNVVIINSESNDDEFLQQTNILDGGFEQATIDQEEITNGFEQATNNKRTIESGYQNNGVCFAEYFKIIGNVFIKPFSIIKENSEMLCDIRNSGLLVGIVVVVVTILNLIKQMFNAVYQRSFNFWEGEYETEIDFSNLGDLEYFSIIGKNLLVWLAIIAIIAGVYFIASLILKKQTNFSKLLGISAISIVPFMACLFIVSPILGIIHYLLSIIVIVAGFIYTFLILYEAMNKEVELYENKKGFVNLICLTVILSTSLYLYMEFMMGAITGLMKLF